jgi:glycosyltransferase involved in cell wall biosynthesis
VAARAGSIPEVVGDAATLFDPQDCAAIEAAMERVLGYDEPERARLAEVAYERARLFRREQMIEKTLAVYSKAIASSAAGEGGRAIAPGRPPA